MKKLLLILILTLMALACEAEELSETEQLELQLYMYYANNPGEAHGYRPEVLVCRNRVMANVLQYSWKQYIKDRLTNGGLYLPKAMFSAPWTVQNDIIKMWETCNADPDYHFTTTNFKIKE